jgi:hypothetical protein
MDEKTCRGFFQPQIYKYRRFSIFIQFFLSLEFCFMSSRILIRLKIVSSAFSNPGSFHLYLTWSTAVFGCILKLFYV